LEQLIEPDFQSPDNAWNKTPNQDELKRRRLGCRSVTRWRKRRRKFNPFLSLIIIGNVRSLSDKMDKLGAAGISGRDLAAGTTVTALCSALRLYEQTETADREVTVKEEHYRAG